MTRMIFVGAKIEGNIMQNLFGEQSGASILKTWDDAGATPRMISPFRGRSTLCLALRN